MTRLLAWEDARRHVLDGVTPLPARATAVSAAHGHALASAVVSPEAMPSFDNSAMDGFAVRAADVRGASRATPVRLAVRGFLPAGEEHTGDPLATGQAIRIMTGAPIPAGADAVVPVEETDAWDPEGQAARTDPGEWVAIHVSGSPGHHIRRTGESVRAGEVVFEAGHRLRAQDIGLLISVGVTEVNVHSLPRIGVLSTGSELTQPGKLLKSGQIRDSNRPALLLRLEETGFPGVDLGTVGDDARDLEAAIRDALPRIDFLITSGGVSVGDRDLTRAALTRLGRVEAYRVAVRPGMPQAFGHLDHVPVFGLPGNPVSSLVVFDQFVLPALRKLAGRRDVIAPLFDAVLLDPIARRPGRAEFWRVRLAVEEGRWVARSTGPQGSGILSSLTRANGYAILAADLETVRPGTTVPCQFMSRD